MTAERTSSTAPISRQQHWRSTRQLTARLLAIWLIFTLAIVFCARELSHVSLFGWPLSFYLVAQGALWVYLGIVAFYVWRMRRLDRALEDDSHAA